MATTPVVSSLRRLRAPHNTFPRRPREVVVEVGLNSYLLLPLVVDLSFYRRRRMADHNLCHLRLLVADLNSFLHRRQVADLNLYRLHLQVVADLNLYRPHRRGVADLSLCRPVNKTMAIDSQLRRAAYKTSPWPSPTARRSAKY